MCCGVVGVITRVLLTALGMDETGGVRRAVPPVGDDGLDRHRLAGDSTPLFPLLWGLWWRVGEQQQVLAQMATAVLCLEEA